MTDTNQNLIPSVVSIDPKEPMSLKAIQ